MKKLLTMTVFLAATLALSACGGEQDSGQSEGADPPEPTQAESEAPANGEAADAPEETAPPEPAPEESAPANDEAAQSGGDGSSGMSVTTIQGEEVSLGGQGEVTALFFMAGW